MLQSMRRHSQSFLIYVLFGMLIVVFVFMFGLPSTDSCDPQTQIIVAEAGNFEINDSDVKSGTMRTFGDTLRGGDKEFKAAQRQVLYNMVTTLLVAEKAEDAGFRVSDDELRQYIVDWEKGNPDQLRYISGGKFDKERYKNFLDYYGLPTERYEAYKRRELLARNYLTMLETSLVVSQVEVRDLFEKRMNRTDLEFIKLEPMHVEHLLEAPTAAEVNAFLAEHMDEVKAAFTANKSEYSTPAKVHLKEIIVQKNDKMLRQIGTETDKAKAPDTRFKILKKAVIDNSMAFDEAAEKYNEALVYRANGGDRGTEELENLSKQHRDALGDKKVGEIVAFETDLTYNVVRIEEKLDATETPLDKVQSDIASTLIKAERADKKMDEVANSIFERVKNGEEFAAALEAVLYAETPAEVPPVDAVDPTVVPDDANPADEPKKAEEEAPQRVKVDVAETGPFSLRGASYGSWSRLPMIGDAPELARAALTLTEASPLAPKVYTVEGSRVIAKLKKADTGTDEQFAGQKERLIQTIRQQKSAALLGDWRSVITLSHPEPSLQSYGPWVQALFDQAQESGQFKVNQAFLTPSGSEVAANE